MRIKSYYNYPVDIMLNLIDEFPIILLNKIKEVNMWIEVCDKLINFNHITKVEKDSNNFQIHFFTDNDKITVEFNDEVELEQVYFNLLERIGSKPIDGFRKEM